MPAQTNPRKSEGAMKTISEVADIIGLPTHVLRFWETKFVQIQPLKRGGGRRFYRPDDVEALLLIKDLLHYRNYTIKGAAKVLPELLKSRLAGQPTAIPEMAEENASSIGRILKIEAIAPSDDIRLNGSRKQTLQALKKELEAIRAMLVA